MGFTASGPSGPSGRCPWLQGGGAASRAAGNRRAAPPPLIGAGGRAEGRAERADVLPNCLVDAEVMAEDRLPRQRVAVSEGSLWGPLRHIQYMYIYICTCPGMT